MPRKHGAVEFFNEIVLPLWNRWQQEIGAPDLCCSVAIFLDQMPEWIAAQAMEDPQEARARLLGKEPLFRELNLIARTIKHYELDRGPDAGLKDVIAYVDPKAPNLGRDAPKFFIKGEERFLDSKKLLKACFIALADELGLEIAVHG